jgi:hypothetical protein
MRDAPSVSYPVGRCLWAAGAMGLVWFAGGAAIAGWLAQGAQPGWRQAFAAAAWLGAGAAALLHWTRMPRGTLAFSGGSWRFREADAAAPRVALDLQRILLLHFDGGAAPLWLWAEQREAPSDWDALRRAVYSRARTAAAPGATPPVDPP